MNRYRTCTVGYLRSMVSGTGYLREKHPFPPYCTHPRVHVLYNNTITVVTVILIFASMYGTLYLAYHHVQNTCKILIQFIGFRTSEVQLYKLFFRFRAYGFSCYKTTIVVHRYLPTVFLVIRLLLLYIGTFLKLNCSAAELT